MLAFRQNSNFIWRGNHMSKIEASKMRFCEWGLNSYNLSIICLLFVYYIYLNSYIILSTTICCCLFCLFLLTCLLLLVFGLVRGEASQVLSFCLGFALKSPRSARHLHDMLQAVLYPLLSLCRSRRQILHLLGQVPEASSCFSHLP